LRGLFAARDHLRKEKTAMFSKTATGLALAAACVLGIAIAQPAQAQPAEVVTNGPQTNPRDVQGWSARQNVIQSQRYDRMVATNPAFRASRMKKECGPITDPQLHAQCIASFSQYEGAGTPQRRY
jgi:hypothetical protein